MICTSDLNAVSTKHRQGVARVWFFPLCFTAWLWLFYRWAETCSLMNFSLSFEDCCDWLLSPYVTVLCVCVCVCMLVCIRVFMYTHMFTYAYEYVRVSVHECRPTYAYIVCMNLCVCAYYVRTYMFPELQCVYKYIHKYMCMCMWYPANRSVTVSDTYAHVTHTATIFVML
jgi:hypothetical protein